MAQKIQYDVIPRHGGWSIACGEVVGPPYNRKTEALEDAKAIARFLHAHGDDVVVTLSDGPERRRLLELRN